MDIYSIRTYSGTISTISNGVVRNSQNIQVVVNDPIITNLVVLEIQ